jgi:hypothetical protein
MKNGKNFLKTRRGTSLRGKGAIAQIWVALATINSSKAAFAAGGLVGMLSNIDALSKAAVTTITYLSLVAGVSGIVYGLKLIKDRSNERENVKLSHIFFSLGGGAGLVMLWFIITALVETAGGSSSDIGRQQSF